MEKKSTLFPFKFSQMFSSDTLRRKFPCPIHSGLVERWPIPFVNKSKINNQWVRVRLRQQRLDRMGGQFVTGWAELHIVVGLGVRKQKVENRAAVRTPIRNGSQVTQSGAR